MQGSPARYALVAGSTAVLAAVTGMGTTTAVAHTASTTPSRIIDVTLSKKVVTIAGGTTLAPGHIDFRLTSKGGEHTLQLLKLHKGYTPTQFKKDVAAGIDQGNDVHAIRRLDRRVTWLGGVDAKKGTTREFGVVLTRGKYYAIDQSGPAFIKLKVTGKKTGGGIATTATVTGTASHRWKSPRVLPAGGWIRLRDTSDEPHFLVLQQVKKSTTAAKVRKYVKSGSQANPPWLLKHSATSGAFSRRTTVDLKLQVPTGKYLEACFWPSKSNGMPHFFMGMWKLVSVK